jgi:hypothetical protein
MAELATLSPIESLILVRLLPVGEKGDTTAKIQKDLEPLLGHRWSGAVLTDVVDRTIAGLESKGLVVLLPVPGKGKKKKSSPKFVLTSAGQRQGLDMIGAEKLKPKTTWAILKNTYLPARALGLTSLSDASLKTLSSDTGFKAALLKSFFQLPLDGCPTLSRAIDALAWKLIGIESAEKFAVAAVQKALFHRALGDPPTRPADAKKSADLLLARRVGARRNDAKEFRDAVLRGWIDRTLDGSAEAPQRSPPPPAPPVSIPEASPPLSLDLPSFADRVLTAARACPTGRYGDNKVFVAHVWRALRDDPDMRGMELPEFKRRLAEANNARLLDLSRADLVQAMDPEDVRDSEVSYLNATFHFIRIDPERP